MNNGDINYSYYYGNWHSDTDESKNNDVALAVALFDTHAIYPRNRFDRVLEIGCGMGRFLLMLQEKGYTNLVGVDIDKTQIAIAKKTGLDVYLRDVMDFLCNNSDIYDVIYAFDILEHVEKEKQIHLLNMMREHLSDSGFIVIQVPNALAPTSPFFRYADFTHVISYTVETISFLLHNAGLHFFQVRPQHQELPSVQELKLPWARLYRYEFGIKDFILTPNIVAVAFKNKDYYAQYEMSAPSIQNNYNESLYSKKETPFQRFKRHLRRFFENT